jgi:hypothetical protein
MKLSRPVPRLPGYSPPPQGEASPLDHLVHLLCYDRAYMQAGGRGGTDSGRGRRLSDGGIRRLVQAAFYASMSPDEGRFPRLRVAVLEAAGSIFDVARFDPVRLDGPESLRKLAPACTHPACALVVSERDGGLFCAGIANVGPMGYEWTPGQPGVTAGGPSPELQIAIREPGHLIADGCGPASYELRAGEVRQLSPYWLLPQVRALSEDWTGRLTREVAKLADDAATALFGGTRRSPLLEPLLSRMLRVAVEARHGAAFVVLPLRPDEPDPVEIRIHHHTRDLDLGMDAAHFWVACVKHSRNGAREPGLVRDCVARRTKMLTDAEAVGSLGGVDGCVVMDRGLRVRGFGGEILVSELAAQDAPRRFRKAGSGEEWGYDEFMTGIGGTRHRSAARLCRAVGGAVVFVVSQDGGLKLLCSTEDQVNAFGPLDLPGLRDPLY